jgi:putative colanic acid biosynthesis UDP-glucose lipid carrier transferase
MGAGKRVVDIVVASLLLLILSPLLAVVALAIAIEGKGSIFFSQTRTGLNGKKFRLRKFRTMWVTEDGETAVQCSHNDPRVTPLGHLLRKYSVDELPQLVNVLSGEMSIVGPRPHPQSLDEEFGNLSGYADRYLVRPGITGLAQILGYRGPTLSLDAMQRRVNADLEYIRRRSLRFDLYIILRSIPAVLVRRNAV